MALIFSEGRGEHSKLVLQELCPTSMINLGDYINEGSQSGGSDEEHRCKELVFFYLLHCFRSSHGLTGQAVW